MNKEEVSPMEDFIGKIIVNQAKNTMINTIRNIDNIEWLKQEFENTLIEKWEKEKQLKDIKEFIKSQSPDAGVCGKTILNIIERNNSNE